MANCVYICCPGHSGSTLLDLLLGSHSKVASLGEISHLSKNLALNTQCTCGRAVRECPVWKEIMMRIGARLGIDPLADPYALNTGMPKATNVVDHLHQTRAYLLRRRLILAFVYLEQRGGLRLPRSLVRAFEQSIENNLLLYDMAGHVMGVDMITDSSKSYLKPVALYRKQPINTRLILLTRDGRGVLYSNIKRKFSRRTGVYGWKNYYSRALPIFKRYVANEHIIRVRYEDLSSEPAKELRRICNFLGLEFEESMLDFSSHIHHITNGNNMRFNRASQIAPDTSWSQELLEFDLHYFERKAGRLNHELGYQ